MQLYAHYIKQSKVKGGPVLIITTDPTPQTEIQRYQVAGVREAKQILKANPDTKAWNF